MLNIALNKYIKDGASVLELGCGNCKVLNEIAESKKLSQLVGVDLYKHENFPENAEYLNLDLENFDMNGEFDVIIMDNVLEHIKNYLTLVEKLKNNLKENGALLIAVPNRYGWNNEAKVYFPAHGKHYVLFDTESLKFTLERLGYACCFYNIYGEYNKPLWMQFLLKVFRIQNPVIALAAFKEK